MKYDRPTVKEEKKPKIEQMDCTERAECYDPHMTHTYLAGKKTKLYMGTKPNDPWVILHDKEQLQCNGYYTCKDSKIYALVETMGYGKGFVDVSTVTEIK